MTDKEFYLEWWTPTLGEEEALRSWEVKQQQQKKLNHIYMPDIDPYQSMVTGEMITGRAQHREHLKKHNLNEIGNETKYLTNPQPPKDDGRLKRLIADIVYGYR